MKHKYLFIDRDGTLIKEPFDEQVDSIDKIELLPGVFSALQELQQQNYKLIMISNQDGLGTQSFPEENFVKPHEFLLNLFKSQAITFDDILICPHKPEYNCDCRKPKLGLVLDYLRDQSIDRDNSFVIGDRDSDMQLAKNLGIPGLKIESTDFPNWSSIKKFILNRDRTASIHRKTKETDILLTVNLDDNTLDEIDTGISFLDHMLQQLVNHGGIGLQIKAKGDLEVDDHHLVEDVAICLGQAIHQALGDKWGINRYGFLMPMDESLAYVAMDLSGRSFCRFDACLNRDKVGELSTELVPHFFQSLSEHLKANIHIKLEGENCHHMVEACFKAFAKVLQQAVAITHDKLPSSKGVL